MKGITQKEIDRLIYEYGHATIEKMAEAIYNAIKPIQLPKRKIIFNRNDVELEYDRGMHEDVGFNRCHKEVIKLNGGGDE